LKLKSLLLLTVFAVSLLAGGCSSNTSKKPLTPTPQTKQTQPAKKPLAKPQTTTPSTTISKQVADRAAAQAAMVKGVKGATAVVSGKELDIGLDLNANTQKGTVSSIENSVLNRVKNAEPGYTVYVTSDVDSVTRIKNVAQGVAKGTPITSFKNELQTLNSRIMVKSRK
jgi:YhcN/YlaJ family sporulation lipoprotein